MKKIRVLMIDDNQALVEMVKEYFSDHKQIEVSLCCKDGEEGLKTIINESDKYDIILLDLVMPVKDGMYVLSELNKRGICVSGGSACAAGSTKPSHVLTALGLPDEMAKAAIRTTFGPDNTKEDIDYLVQNLKEILYN